jgi:hypothetical protein
MAELKLPEVPKTEAPKLDIPKAPASDSAVRNLTSMTPSNVSKGPMDIIEEMKSSQTKTFQDIATERKEQYNAMEAEQYEKSVVEENARKAKQKESLKQDKQLDEFMSGQRSKELPYPDFQPTQETGVSIAELGGMLATLGVMLGTGAKGNAIAAVGALRGAMDGWNKGRKDLWQKEMKTFETEVNKMKTHNEQLNKYTQQYLQLYPTRRAEAMQNAEMAIRIAGSNSIFAHTIRTKKSQDVITDLNNLNKATQETLLKILKIQGDLKKQEFDKEKFNETKRHNKLMEVIAELRASKSGSSKSGMLKPGAEVTKNYIGYQTLMADMAGVIEDLKKPSLRKLIADNRATAFASEKADWLDQILSKKVPSELRQFLVKIKAIRNNNYLFTSGKAVTGGEAMRNYGVVAQPGDTPEYMDDKIKIMNENIARTITQYQKLYGLPSLDKDSISSFRDKDNNFDVRKVPINDEFPTPTAEDIAYAKKNPDAENLFIKHFGRKP